MVFFAISTRGFFTGVMIRRQVGLNHGGMSLYNVQSAHRLDVTTHEKKSDASLSRRNWMTG